MYADLHGTSVEVAIGSVGIPQFSSWTHPAPDAHRRSPRVGHATIVLLMVQDIQAAVRLVLPGELAKHAVSEGTKAVAKVCCSSDAGYGCWV